MICGEAGRAALARLGIDAGSRTFLPAAVDGIVGTVLDVRTVVVPHGTGLLEVPVAPAGAGIDGRIRRIGRVADGTLLDTAASVDDAVVAWCTTAATELVRTGDTVLEALIDHVRTRTIGGRPLGARQVVQHRIADRWVELQAAALAARSGPADPTTALAVWLGAARAVARLCDEAVRFRGAGGYLADDVAARARAEVAGARLALGDPDEAAARVGHGLPPRRAADTPARRAVRTALATVWDERRATEADATGVLHDPGVHRAVAGQGWLGAFVAHAGLNPELSPTAAFEIAEELALVGVPTYALNTSAMTAAVLQAHGSAPVQREVLPRLLAGRAVAALGYTEPEAGSDLANIRTVAARAADGRWRISGTKLYCTLADVADHALVLARSDPGSERHRGLTLFLVPLAATGVRVEPLPTAGGEATTRLTLDDVEVDDDLVVGQVDRGWAVVMDALRFERNATPWCDGVRLLDAARDLFGDHPATATRLGWAFVDVTLGRALVDQLLDDTGALGEVAPSAVKLFTTEALVAMADSFVAALPADGMDRPAARRIAGLWRRAISLTIAGGASEVQRDVIARRGLQLPAG
ncbi:MAG TPA: acyl-CoA dehydrogenase family protein [Acidimicrobiales bacterium]|nr:acyl-CoA dehydrogenase family protein [Acidimicrobiales bacterium]